MIKKVAAKRAGRMLNVITDILTSNIVGGNDRAFVRYSKASNSVQKDRQFGLYWIE
jgi:hypothetical protein